MPRPTLLIATRNPEKMREYRQLLWEAPFELVSLEDLGITAEVEETGSTFHENARLKARSYAAWCRAMFETCPYVLADDSGLEVDALSGEPGVRSARYVEASPHPPFMKGGLRGISMGKGGPGRNSDADRVRLLLRNLEGVPWEHRTARFRCVIAIATPAGGRSLNAATRPEAQTNFDESPITEIPPSPLQKSLLTPLFPRGEWGNLTLVVGSVAGMIQYSPLGDEGFGYDPVFYLPSFKLTMAQLPLEEKNRISHRADAARKAAALLQQIAFSHQRSAEG